MKKLNGWLCFDKPEGVSSNFAMAKVRKIFGTRETGYVGTLDPFATGVLPIAVGEARKFIRFIEESVKMYVFTAIFGATTDTLDKDGNITETCQHIPAEKEISENLRHFIGEIEQIPPVFSAIKIGGKRACDRVRRGETVEIPPRRVKISDFRMLRADLEKNEATFEVTCSQGTYIRSLARDFAEKSGSLAYVKSLRRTKSGFFSISDTISLEKLQEMKDTTESVSVLAPVESPLDDIPALRLGSEDIGRLRNGLRFFAENSDAASMYVRIVDKAEDTFCGIGFVSEDGLLRPVRMCVNN
ncbi:MAG: tRNA pseudouridine(55) synthase TruB [Holosporaceae bacterium]|jgi:tRNA pseudouridine55 synthase|nr:tRNA pseudouridine(55) synthase TruB [Holosporaceae bacterium]